MKQRPAEITHEAIMKAQEKMKNKIKVAIVVGHSESSKGAYSALFDVNEWDYNDTLAMQIHTLLHDSDTIRPVIVYREKGLRQLVRKLNWVVRPHLIVSLHLNSFGNPQANGTEVLHYHKSKISRRIACIFEEAIQSVMGTRDRSGANTGKAVTEEDRGGYLLCYTKAKAVLVEPFFMSNAEEMKKGLEFLDDGSLAEAYAEAIKTSCILL